MSSNHLSMMRYIILRCKDTKFIRIFSMGKEKNRIFCEKMGWGGQELGENSYICGVKS